MEKIGLTRLIGRIVMFFLLIAAAAVMAGCASYNVQSIPSRIDESKTVKIGDDDISITAFPILTEDDSKKYFDKNLINDNVLAIYSNILNTSSKSVEVVSLKLVIFGRETALEPLTTEEIYKVVRREYVGKSTVWLFLGAYVGAPISAMHTKSVNKDIEQDLQGKILKLGDVNPKTFTHGFIWFKIPDVAMKDEKFPKGDLRIVMKKDGKLVDYNLLINP